MKESEIKNKQNMKKKEIANKEILKKIKEE
jgi:hypothetical protein